MQRVALLWNYRFHDMKTRCSVQRHLGSANVENQIIATTQYKLRFLYTWTSKQPWMMVRFMERNGHTDMRYVTALLLDCELQGCDITMSSGWSPTFWSNLPSLYLELSCLISVPQTVWLLFLTRR
jgi:hypothetical protein